MSTIKFGTPEHFTLIEREWNADKCQIETMQKEIAHLWIMLESAIQDAKNSRSDDLRISVMRTALEIATRRLKELL